MQAFTSGLINMTTIAYKDGILAADRKNILNREGGDVELVFSSKIYISSCKRMALALTGTKPDDNMVNMIFQVIEREILVASGRTPRRMNDKIDLKDASKMLFHEINAFPICLYSGGIVTLSGTLPQGNLGLAITSLDDVIAIGSGSIPARYFMLNGYSAIDAVRKTMTVDIMAGGSMIDAVDVRQLKDIYAQHDEMMDRNTEIANDRHDANTAANLENLRSAIMRFPPDKVADILKHVGKSMQTETSAEEEVKL